MSSLSNANERFTQSLSRVLDVVKKRIFGHNNERLDYLIDSFYKLSPQQQTGVLAGVAGSLFVLVILTFVIYFSRVSALETQLDQSLSAMQQLRALAQSHSVEDRRYRDLQSLIIRSSNTFKPKPFFESLGNQLSVQITDLRSGTSDIPPDRATAKDFQNVTVDLRMPKVSLPRLLRLLSEVERSDNYLHINSLQIRARYGDRLYFETAAKVHGFKPGR